MCTALIAIRMLYRRQEITSVMRHGMQIIGSQGLNQENYAHPG